MEITAKVIEHLLKTDFDMLPAHVVEKTKRQILDTLGVMLPPSTLEKNCAALHEIVKEGGGKLESTLLGFGGKAPCWMAAFVNGSLCHPMDYDDTYDEGPTHPSSNTVPAALAIAERAENISGKDFIAAVALGIDLHVRLADAPRGKLSENYPWYPMTVFGVFSATAAAGKLLRLSHGEMLNAFGIALDRASGVAESITSPDSGMRAIRDGFANREGVLAVLMAQKGVTAFNRSLEVLYKVFYGNNYDPSAVTSRIGEDFAGLKVSLKPWPACRVTHTYIKAALDLVKQHRIAAEQIHEVVLSVGKYGRDFLCLPVEAKRRPTLSINAKFSLPFTMGVAFAKGKIAIEDFLPEMLSDPKVLEIADKVKYTFDPALEGTISPGVVKVRTLTGESFVKREDIPYGHPKNPISDQELIDKFKNCGRFSRKKISEKNIQNLIDMILGLEHVKNVREITRVLA